MSYRILIMPRAHRDQQEIARWIAKDSSVAASRWLDALHDAIGTLAELPRRCPLAPESSRHPEGIRQLILGDYRILFTIRGATVLILHVRHSARQARENSE